MELIIDANVLFSALIKESHTRSIILSSNLTFYVPEFIFEEVKKHIITLSEKAKLTEEELKLLIGKFLVTANIKIAPSAELKQFWGEAEKISPDPDDAPYFALALKLQCAIWSNDTALKKQDKIKVYSTADITKMLSEKS